jgi:hypothetical protein
MNLVLTKNFYLWMRAVLLGTNTNISSSTTSAGGFQGVVNTLEPMKDINGNEYTGIAVDTSSTKCHVTLNYWDSNKSNGTHFIVGNNNAYATEDDYSLSGGYIKETDYSSVCRAVSNPTMINGRGQLVFNVSITAMNNITIGEIGLVKLLPYSLSSSAERPVYLFGRVALDAPINLASGESATFQITIEI